MLASESQVGGTDLVPGRSEGAEETVQARRLWLNDGSCVRKRPSYQNHVWSYDFLAARTHDGRPLRMLAVMDEFTRECLALDVERRL